MENKIQKQIKSFDDTKIGFSILIQFSLINQKINIFILRIQNLRKSFYKLIENYFVSFDTVMIRSSYLKN